MEQKHLELVGFRIVRFYDKGLNHLHLQKIRTGKYVLISWVFDFRGSTAFRTFKKFPYKNHGKRLRLAANKWDWSEDQKHNYIFVWPKKQLEVSVHPTLCWEPEEKKDIYNLSEDTLQNWYVFIYCNKHASQDYTLENLYLNIEL